MHQKYLKTHQDISYSAFYSTFKSMNITIAKLGNEQCEMCELYENHKKQYQCELVCDIREYFQHKKNIEQPEMNIQKTEVIKTLIMSEHLQEIIFV